MAKRRCFSIDILSSNKFCELSSATKMLYIYLNLYADDFGMVGNSKSIVRLLGARNSNLKVLEETGFVHIFDSGVLAIVHWNDHNKIRKDRLTPTLYQREYKQFAQIKGFDNDLPCQNDNQNASQDKISQDNIIQDNINEDNTVFTLGKYQNVFLKSGDFEKLKADNTNWEEIIECLSEYKERTGKVYNNDYLAISHWVIKAVREKPVDKKKSIDSTYDLTEIEKRIMFNNDYDI